jgi:hypothetical protein
LVHPADSRSNAWEDVADLSASFGVELDPWQELVLRAALGERAGGRWAAQQVALSAPRQNGKSQLIVARALAGALLFGERLIVISAHQADTARETFQKFMEQIDQSPALLARLRGGSVRDGVMNAVNREHIKFQNGAMIKFKARTGSGGRGFSADCLLLDEAQILGARAWASIRPTMSARKNPQVWLLGTPPTPEDDGEVFARIRESALAGKTTRLAYAEWSADPDADPSLVETRRSANPAWDSRINHELVQGEYESMSAEQFALERLGIWPSDTRSAIFPNWPDLAAEFSMAGRGSYGMALDVSSDLAYSSVAVAAGDADVQVDYRRNGVGVVLDQVRDVRAQLGISGPVLLMGRNAATYAADLDARGVATVIASNADRVGACARLNEAVTEGQLRHRSQEPLSLAVSGAKWSTAPDGRVLDRRHAAADLGPLYAVAGALLALSSDVGPPPPIEFTFG